MLPKSETNERLLPTTVNDPGSNPEKLSRSNSTYPSKRLLTCRSSSKCKSMRPLSNNKIMLKRWTSKMTNKTKKTMHTVTKWLTKTAVQIMTTNRKKKRKMPSERRTTGMRSVFLFDLFRYRAILGKMLSLEVCFQV